MRRGNTPEQEKKQRRKETPHSHIPARFQGQVGQGLEQPDLVESVPACGRGLEQDEL